MNAYDAKTRNVTDWKEEIIEEKNFILRSEKCLTNTVMKL